jgi:dihydroflavonol-4-reductase
MKPDPRFWAGKRVCVTGGTGFLGWQIVRQLLTVTPHVRLLGLRPTSKPLAALLQSHDCVFGDVRDPSAVREAVRNCQIVFHTAGTVAVWGPALEQMHEIHVVGTQQVVLALPVHARLVHTSSVVAIGAARTNEVLMEESPFTLQALQVDYVHAKKAAEDAVLQTAARGMDAVIVNPSYLIGPEDYQSSVMGRLCLRFWKGRVPLVPPGALNFVDVRDAALGHLLAAERGRRGCRYILGGENQTMREFARQLAQVGGLSRRWRYHMPVWMQTALAWLAERRSAYLLREPYPSLQFARMSRYRWRYSSARAEAELGYRARPVLESLNDAHRWFCEHGWLKPIGTAVPEEQTKEPDRRAA